jgi:hypothetical protein
MKNEQSITSFELMGAKLSKWSFALDGYSSNAGHEYGIGE